MAERKGKPPETLPRQRRAFLVGRCPPLWIVGKRGTMGVEKAGLSGLLTSEAKDGSVMAGKPKIFIDGKGGVVGAKIAAMLSRRDDLELLLIDPEKRRDVEERKKLLNMADLALLCLPSETARGDPRPGGEPRDPVCWTPPRPTGPQRAGCTALSCSPASASGSAFQAGGQSGMPRVRLPSPSRPRW